MELSPRALEVLDQVRMAGADDVAIKDGRVFSLAYFASAEVDAVAERAYAMYSSANGLNTDAFPSLRRFQSEVVQRVTDWVGGGPSAAGFMTSGGTESLLMAVKAARERGRRERGITRPNVILPTSAHAAFEKGCDYFGVEARRVAVGDDWRAVPEAMEAACDDETVLVVGSAPQYPQGVIDPIPALAAIAARRDINCHVDACMGGVTLAYMERLGEIVAPWNLSVEGVTSISVDLHKYGYTAKGASVIVHRDKKLRADQTFVTDNWLGGMYGSSGVLGTKSGGPMAAAWAVMNLLGDDGYLELTNKARRACLHLADSIERIDGLRLRARPESTLLSFGAVNPEDLDIFAVADELARRGWYLDRQYPPPSLHCTVNASHATTIDTFVADLSDAVGTIGERRGGAGAYGTVE